MRVRLLDLGTVPYVDSQAIYHGVAYAMGSETPNTISLMSPDRPYLCIGYHQELEKEIDTAYCEAHGLPVLRREVGGGAVYLDGGQLFVHFVFRREDLPRKVEDLYALFIRPIVETYRSFGIEAEHRPLNDIVVGGRKIGGTGIAAIGEAMVVAGSLMLDFDTRTMAQALRVSSEKMRDKVFQGLEEYMTTMTRELGAAPARDEVAARYVARLGPALGVQLEPGSLSVEEHDAIRRLRRRFRSARWLRQKSGLARRGILIRSGVTIAEAEHKAPGGLIRVTARLADGRLDDLSISGDFTFHPALLLGELEAALRGLELDETALTAAARAFFASTGVQAPGVGPEDLARALILLADERAPARS